MGLLERFRRGKREDRLVTAPASKPPKVHVRKAGARRTRKQVAGRRKAMLGRKVNVQRLKETR